MFCKMYNVDMETSETPGEIKTAENNSTAASDKFISNWNSKLNLMGFYYAGAGIAFITGIYQLKAGHVGNAASAIGLSAFMMQNARELNEKVANVISENHRTEAQEISPADNK